ncbi:MAG: hypothetical protein KDN22_28620 [Verrucomicrobiae bacterium]|nr:hypothetical protein [Verrucomicrobiae bacterium]
MLNTATAAPVRSGAVEAELIAGADGLVSGHSVTVAVRLKTADHWHVYWENPGDSGTPVKVTWELPDSAKAGELQFPAPKEYEIAGFVTYGHEGEVFLLSQLNLAPNVPVGTIVPVKAKVSWLACDPNRCVPGRAELSLNLKVTATDPKPNRWTTKIKLAQEGLPIAVQGTAKASAGKVTIEVPAKNLPKIVGASKPAGFFPAQSGHFKIGAPKPSVTTDSTGNLKIILQKEAGNDLPDEIRGVVTFTSGPPFLVKAPHP